MNEKSPDRKKQVATTIERYGADYYSTIGKIKRKRVFDDPEKAREAGRKSAAARKLKKEQQSE